MTHRNRKERWISIAPNMEVDSQEVASFEDLSFWQDKAPCFKYVWVNLTMKDGGASVSSTFMVVDEAQKLVDELHARTGMKPVKTVQRKTNRQTRQWNEIRGVRWREPTEPERAEYNRRLHYRQDVAA